MTRRRIAGLTSFALLLAACGLRFQTGAGGLRTYALNTQPNVLCNTALDLAPPTGVLAGAPDDPERVWLEGLDGRRMSVAWPQGFSVEFTPDAVLRNERGVVVATAGARVELHGAHEFEGDGSFDRPYIPYKTFGCYPPAR